MLAPFPNMTFDQGRNRISMYPNQIRKKRKELTGFPKFLFELDFTVTKVTSLAFELVFLLEDKSIHSMLHFFRVSTLFEGRKL